MEVEDQIQLANVAEIFVQDLHEGVNQLQDDEFVIVLIDDRNEVEASITLINYLIFLIVDKIAHFGFASDDQLIDLCSCKGYFFEESLLFHLWHIGGIPLGKTGSSVTTNEKEAMNHAL